jgi:hypothetical protein
MSKFEKSMEQIFDVVPSTNNKPPVPVVAPKEKTDSLDLDLEEDYKEARDTLKELVTKGNHAIDHLLAIASDTEHPRAFEVVATLIKNTAEANEKLLNMQKQMRDMKGLTKKDSSGVNVDKAIFVGSTSELNKLLKAKNNSDNE